MAAAVAVAVTCGIAGGLCSPSRRPRQRVGVVRAVRTRPCDRHASVVEYLERMYRAGGHRRVKVAFQGGEGSYCHEAAQRAFGRCEGVACDGQMECAFNAVDAEFAAEKAVVAVENSLDGVIDRNLDLLLRHPRLVIEREVLMAVDHCLLTCPTAKPKEINKIVSHPQALLHCRRRLQEAFSGNGVQLHAVENAAAAAKYVAENGLRDTAVIGSRAAARAFELTVLCDRLQDDPTNTTRFLVLSHPSSSVTPLPEPLAVGQKTTVAFSLRDGTNALHRAMSVFEGHGISVSKILTRPNRHVPVRCADDRQYFDYVFFLDLECSHAERVRAALRCVRDIAGFFRILGSYSTVVA